jgi:hypothetical protein
VEAFGDAVVSDESPHEQEQAAVLGDRIDAAPTSEW